MHSSEEKRWMKIRQALRELIDDMPANRRWIFMAYVEKLDLSVEERMIYRKSGVPELVDELLIKYLAPFLKEVYNELVFITIYSEPLEQHVGLCLQFPDLSCKGDTKEGALDRIKTMVRDCS